MNKIELEKLVNQGLSQKEIAEKLVCSQTTVRYHLKKYNLNTFAKKKYEVFEEKNCSKCNQNKILDDFYKRKRGDYSGYCKDCTSANSAERQKRVGLERKNKLIKQFGGGCKICGYNKCLASLSFHHKDPGQKLFNLSARELGNNSWKLISAEAAKCELLCLNCHQELHYNEQ